MRKITVQAVVWGVASLFFSATTTTASEARFFRVTGPVPTVITDVTPEGWVTWTNIATNATFTVQTATMLTGESNWVDWAQVPVDGAVTVHHMFDPDPPAGMAFIPAGIFMMGATTNVGHEYVDNEVPQHPVNVSAFYMDQTEVTNDKMVEVMQWGYQQGKIYVDTTTVRNLEGNQQELLDLDEGFCRITWDGSQFQMKAAKGSGYPCVEVTWYGAVAFCNYLTLMETGGLTPCYSLSDWSCNWSADGYRLPTEAEWEKAARGGVLNHRFPWSDTEEIQHSQANYISDSNYAYDTSPTRGFHPNYDDGEFPYTSPVGSFAATGYPPGLFNMAGNVSEWCWDWYSFRYYGSSPLNDPQGPTEGSGRVGRGGGWPSGAIRCRVASRDNIGPPLDSWNFVGFRCVRAAGQ